MLKFLGAIFLIGGIVFLGAGLVLGWIIDNSWVNWIFYLMIIVGIASIAGFMATGD